MMEQLTIFDVLDEDQNVETDNKYAERIERAFDELLDFSKQSRNPVYMRIERVPMSLRSYLVDFIKRGWIKKVKSDSDLLSIEPQYLKYHTVEELVEAYRHNINELLAKPDVCWYRDVLALRNFSGVIQYRNNEEKERFYAEKRGITKEAALQLGLNHFLNVPSSRGTKMGTVSAKWVRKHVLPTIAAHIIPITDIDVMEQFFKDHVFFFGRRDWNWKLNNYKVPAYPEFKSFSPTEFDLACLVQATDIKTVGMIFEYIGYASGSLVTQGKTVIYPEGWSMAKYEESLTEEDRERMHSDSLRIAGLKNGGFNNGE